MAEELQPDGVALTQMFKPVCRTEHEQHRMDSAMYSVGEHRSHESKYVGQVQNLPSYPAAQTNRNTRFRVQLWAGGAMDTESDGDEVLIMFTQRDLAMPRQRFLEIL